MTQDPIELVDALRLLAFVGDLSMGQPTDHSPRVVWLATKLGARTGLDEQELEAVAQVAWLRWSGCTANASVAEATVSDDVAGRAAMLALQSAQIGAIVGPTELSDNLGALADINCEVSAFIAAALGCNPSVTRALEATFERWDGDGRRRLMGQEIPRAAQFVRIASELEIFSRVYGHAVALDMLGRRSDSVHSNALVAVVQANADRWISELDALQDLSDPHPLKGRSRQVELSLLGDVIDLKLPWLLGTSKALAQLSGELSMAVGLKEHSCSMVRRAAYLHGLGRAAIPNSVWNRPGPLSRSEWERARLSPYWTARAGAQIVGLSEAADVASRVYERLDGTGYFRGSRQTETTPVQRVLPVANLWVSLRSPRPWRAALEESRAIDLVRREVTAGRFDPAVVEALIARITANETGSPPASDKRGTLTAREIEILGLVSSGDSNKEAARRLGISPSTVRRHLESVFRKLDCRSRAAATLKAMWLGLL